MNKDVSKKIIDKIKKDHIEPEPKWKVNLVGHLFWFLLVLIVFLAAAFFSLALLSLSNFDLELYRLVKIRKFVRLLVLSAPYLWLVLLVLFLALSYMAFRKTKRGYRYNILLIAAVILFVVSVLGVGAHFAKVNNQLERGISSGPPFLRRMAPLGERGLVHPGEGVLGGVILELSQNDFSLEDFEKKQWEVLYDEETKIRKGEKLEQGLEVLVVGEEIDEDLFDAEAIRPIRPELRGGPPLEEGKPLPKGLRKMRIEVEEDD